jgi:hypothetical protein
MTIVTRWCSLRFFRSRGHSLTVNFRVLAHDNAVLHRLSLGSANEGHEQQSTNNNGVTMLDGLRSLSKDDKYRGP